MKREKDILAAVLLYLGTRPDCVLFRQNSGALRDRLDRVVRFGVPGCADVTGAMAPHGRRFEIETKSTDGRLSVQQNRFRAAIERVGGLYLVVREVADLYPYFPPLPSPEKPA